MDNAVGVDSMGQWGWPEMEGLLVKTSAQQTDGFSGISTYITPQTSDPNPLVSSLPLTQDCIPEADGWNRQLVPDRVLMTMIAIVNKATQANVVNETY